MASVSHIATRLSSAPHYSSRIDTPVHVFCIYCGVELANVKRGIPKEPLACPLHLENYSGQEWRACAECANIAATLWYYAGSGQSYFPKPKLRGAALDVYVWILRESPEDEFTVVPIPLVANRLRYSRAAIAAALIRLRKRGILERRTRSGRYGEYRPLLWQRPKGE